MRLFPLTVKVPLVVICVEPVEVEYHLVEPALGVADTVTLPKPHTDPAEVVVIVGRVQR